MRRRLVAHAHRLPERRAHFFRLTGLEHEAFREDGPRRALDLAGGHLRARNAIDVSLAIDEPADAQQVGVVDGHAPLEVRAGEETVRPEAGATHRPQLAVVRLAFEHPAIREAVLELVERDLQMRGRLPAAGAAQDARP